MGIARVALIVGMAGLLAGCVTGRSETVRAMPKELMKTTKVAAITVKGVPDNASQDFSATMERELRKAMDLCATGTEPLDLEVTVTDFKASNAAKAIFIGDSNNIKGTARLLRAGETVGDFDISRSVGAGGIAGAIIMSNAEENTAIGFSREVCEKAFGRAPGSRRR